MDQLIKELKKIFSFKTETRAGDVVLVVTENPQAMYYALITAIERDNSKREEWWQVALHFLTFPPRKIVWILREPQFTGKEIFTMGGEKMFVQALDFGQPGESAPKGDYFDAGPKKTGLRIVK